MRYESIDGESDDDAPAQTLTYFYPSINNYVLNFPMLLRSEENISDIITYLEDDGFFNYIRNARPSSRWKPVFITQIRFHTVVQNFFY